MEKILQELGLNPNEIKIYLALLPLGTSSSSVLGLRTGIPRSTAKYTCQNLLKKGLVTRLYDNNVFQYTALNPEKLEGLLDRQKKALSRKEAQLGKLINDLKVLYNPQGNLSVIRFYDGVENVIKMFEEFLEEGEKSYGVGMVDEEWDPEFRKYLYNQYIPRRAQKKFYAPTICNDNPATREYQKTDSTTGRISLIVPEEQFPFPGTCQIYNNKVAFYSLEAGNTSGVIIENSLFYQSMLSIFKLAWNNARSLPANKKYKNTDLL